MIDFTTLPLRDLMALVHNIPPQTDQFNALMNEIEDRNIHAMVIKSLRVKEVKILS